VLVRKDQTTSDNSENEISDNESLNDNAGLNLLHCWRVSGIRPIKKRRTTFERRLKTESPWWSTFLTPEKRELYHQFPDSRDATLFRRIFKVPYSFFKEKIFNFAVETWWNDWHRNSTEFNDVQADYALIAWFIFDLRWRLPSLALSDVSCQNRYSRESSHEKGSNDRVNKERH
jgi:hypothetical protein